jgi:hypothetical protein
MEPNLKMAIEEQSKLLRDICDHLFAQETRWCTLETTVAWNTASPQHLEANIAIESLTSIHVELDAQVTAAIERLDEVEAAFVMRLGALVSAYAAFESWRPDVEASVDEIHTSVHLLRDEVSKWAAQAPPPQLDTAAGILGPYQSVAERSPAAAYNTDSPDGNCFDKNRWGHGFGHLLAQNHLPINGTPDFMFHPPLSHLDPHEYHDPRPPRARLELELGKLPLLNFPSFDGENQCFLIVRLIAINRRLID